LPIDHALLLRDHRVACGQIVREHKFAVAHYFRTAVRIHTATAGA
jgi:hypothetical protein